MSALAGELTVELADYADPRDAADLLVLLDAYARDPMGGGKPLDHGVRDKIVPGLTETSGAFSLIARFDGEAIGLANCFTGFSTFAARPLVNVHDLGVLPGIVGAVSPRRSSPPSKSRPKSAARARSRSRS